jgi:hypothetical protein
MQQSPDPDDQGLLRPTADNRIKGPTSDNENTFLQPRLMGVPGSPPVVSKPGVENDPNGVGQSGRADEEEGAGPESGGVQPPPSGGGAKPEGIQTRNSYMGMIAPQFSGPPADQGGVRFKPFITTLFINCI